MAKYVTPSYEKLDNPESKGQFFVRLAYGVVGSYMDTKQMTTREVIEEFLQKNGVKTPREFFEKKFKGNNIKNQTETGKEEPKQTEEPKKNMVNNERVKYGTVVTKERIEKVLSCGNNEAKDLTNRLFVDDSFAIGDSNGGNTCFSPFGNHVYLNNVDFKEGENYPYSEGGVFYHECWHGIDYNYSGGFGKRLSIDYVLSDGSTFISTLKAEYDKNIKGARGSGKTIRDEIKSEYNKDLNDYYKSKGYDREKIIADYNALHEQAKKIRHKTYDETKNWSLAFDKEHEFLFSNDNDKIRNLYNKVYDEHPNYLMKKWGDLSDIISGKTSDGYNFGMGHSSSYWNQGGKDNNRAKEAFAEFASAKSTNPESYELLKRLLPQTAKAFDEIWNKLKNGEIKPNGR